MSYHRPSISEEMIDKAVARHADDPAMARLVEARLREWNRVGEVQRAESEKRAAARRAFMAEQLPTKRPKPVPPNLRPRPSAPPSSWMLEETYGVGALAGDDLNCPGLAEHWTAIECWNEKQSMTRARLGDFWSHA